MKKSARKKQSTQPSKRCYWNTCPLRAGFFPDKTCTLGKASVDAKDQAEACSWYVNSEEDHYCFWTWVRRMSNKDGFMEPLLQHEISDLLGFSPTKIHATYKEGVAKLRALPEFKEIEDILK